MKALITGITGFVGGWLAEHLLASGDSLLGCSQSGDWLTSSPHGAVRQIPLVRFSLADSTGLCHSEFARIASFQPDCIFHLAGVARPSLCGRADDVASAALDVNVKGTQRVIDLANELSPRPRLLFVSSSYVYGEGTANDRPVSEDAPPRPRGGYGQSKLAAEQLLRQAAAAGHLEVVIARAFQHTGPRQGPGYMLPTWAWQCARGGTRPVWAYNSASRVDVADVRDIVRGYRLLAIKGCSGETYNVGSGIARQSGEILARLVALAAPGRTPQFRQAAPKFDPVADIQRLTDCTGWRPEIPLDQTLLDTVSYWRERRDARRQFNCHQDVLS